jgi:hypothetical protein
VSDARAEFKNDFDCPSRRSAGGVARQVGVPSAVGEPLGWATERRRSARAGSEPDVPRATLSLDSRPPITRVCRYRIIAKTTMNGASARAAGYSWPSWMRSALRYASRSSLPFKQKLLGTALAQVWHFTKWRMKLIRVRSYWFMILFITLTKPMKFDIPRPIDPPR